MGIIKDRNGVDLIEAKDIKKWQEYIEFSSVQLLGHVGLFATP